MKHQIFTAGDKVSYRVKGTNTKFETVVDYVNPYDPKEVSIQVTKPMAFSLGINVFGEVMFVNSAYLSHIYAPVTETNSCAGLKYGPHFVLFEEEEKKDEEEAHEHDCCVEDVVEETQLTAVVVQEINNEENENGKEYIDEYEYYEEHWLTKSYEIIKNMLAISALLFVVIGYYAGSCTVRNILVGSP